MPGRCRVSPAPLIDAGLVQERMERAGVSGLSDRAGGFSPLEIGPTRRARAGYRHCACLSRRSPWLTSDGNVIAGSELRIEPIADTDRVIRNVAQESRRLIDRHSSGRQSPSWRLSHGHCRG